MSDEDFFNINLSKDGKEEIKNKERPFFSNTPPTLPSDNLKGKIIERKMMTCTTFRIYPNGTMFVIKSQSWFDKNQQEVKKKVKKVVEVKEAVLSKEEVY